MITERLRQARIASGLTQDEVVARLAEHGVRLTKAGLSKYERGGSVPPAQTLLALGRSLGVDSEYFFREPEAEVCWLGFRKASALSKGQQERIKEMAFSQIEAFFRLHAILVGDPSCDLPEPIRVRCLEDAEKAAQNLRQHWKLGEQPIESVTFVIEFGGGLVVDTDGEGDLFDGLAGWVNKTVPVLVMSGAVSDDRRRFSLAHELGHLFMEVGQVDNRMEERLAHRFAAAFLVPATTAQRELGERRRSLDFAELALLKQRHGLSMQAWIFRAADLGIIEQSHARSLFAEMGARGWRRTEPVAYEGREESTRLKQLTLRALAEGLISESEARRILPSLAKETVAIEMKSKSSMDPRRLRGLPRAERDLLLEQAAASIEREYAADDDLRGYDALAERDIHDTSIPKKQ